MNTFENVVVYPSFMEQHLLTFKYLNNANMQPAIETSMEINSSHEESSGSKFNTAGEMAGSSEAL
jgi:hypothetical protein